VIYFGTSTFSLVLEQGGETLRPARRDDGIYAPSSATGVVFGCKIRTVKFTINIPEKISLNKIYAGVHFRERSRHKSDYHLAVMCSPGTWPYTGDFPVSMHYHFRLHGSRLDISNHAYMLKMLEDGLVAHGVLPGDEPKYVGQITISAEQTDKDEFDTVTVTITPCATS
jgi:hypothetical protein